MIGKRFLVLGLILAAAGADRAAADCRVCADAFAIRSGWQAVGPLLRTKGPARAEAEVVLPRGPLEVWVRAGGTLEIAAGPLAKTIRAGVAGTWQRVGSVPGGPAALAIEASAPAEFHELLFLAPGQPAPVAATPAAQRADGLLAAFDFSKSQAYAIFDKAGNGLLRASGRVETVEGPWGQALRCARAGVVLEDGPSCEQAAECLSVEAWIRADDLEGYRAVLFKGLRSVDLQAVHFHFGLFDGKPELKYMDEAGVWSGLLRGGDYPLPAVKPGVWSHVAATFDRGQVRLYLDGREIAARKDRMSRLIPNGFALSVGQGQDQAGRTAFGFSGLIDAMKVSARAMTPAEVAASYEAGRRQHAQPAAPDEKPQPEPEPDLSRKLKIVERYERCLPKDTIGPAKTTAAVRAHEGVAALWINDRPVAPIAMIPIGHFPRDVCRDFAAAGVHIYSHILWTWARIVPEAKNQDLDGSTDWWLGPGEYAFERVDRQVQAIIEADPRAYIFLRVKLNPPAWWVSRHPDELSAHPDGRRAPQYSLASEVWEETYERMLRDLIRHVEQSPYAGHIIGYQPAGGEASEWYWWGHGGGLIDYSPAARDRFRKWLRSRYAGQVAALRQAWNDPQVTFETATPPSEEARRTSEHGFFRDARRARAVIDYQQFLSDMTAGNIKRSCRIVKEATEGRKITGVFYGYSFHYAPSRVGNWNLGFLGLKEVLESPHVDFICSPTDYSYRRGGEPGNFVSAYTASYLLHDKLYWDEVDTRTHHYHGSSPYATRSLAETLSVHQRALGYSLTKGTALWWFTLCGDNTFHDEAIMADIARLQRAALANLGVSKTHVHEVAVLADEQTFLSLRMGVRELMQPLTQALHYKLATMGAPFDMYLLSDIACPRMPDYKLYVMLNPFYLTDAMRQAIKDKLRRNGAAAAWFYAPGYVREDGRLDAGGIGDLTGMRVRESADPRPLRLAITHFDHPITAEIERSDALGRTEPVGPVFWVDDPRAVVLGRLAPDGKPGLAVRDFGTWRSVYSSAPLVTTGLLRGLLRYAGAHVYSTSDDTFYANRHFAMIHAATAGRKEIALPRACDVSDVLTGQSLGRNTRAIRLEMPEQSTRILRLADPE